NGTTGSRTNTAGPAPRGAPSRTPSRTACSAGGAEAQRCADRAPRGQTDELGSTGHHLDVRHEFVNGAHTAATLNILKNPSRSGKTSVEEARGEPRACAV